MIKYIIFDFDGTLADSGEISFNTMNKMAKKHKFKEIEWHEVDKMRKMSVNERCRYMGFPLYKVPFIAAEYYSLYKEAMPELELYGGMHDLTEQLHELGYGIAVISSNSENNIRTFFKNKDVKNIDEILCSHHIFDKDKIINKFLRHHNLKNTEVIYVGDEIRDIKACKKAGVRVIWVDWGLDILSTVQPAEPDFMVSEAKDILSIIKSLGMQD